MGKRGQAGWVSFCFFSLGTKEHAAENNHPILRQQKNIIKARKVTHSKQIRLHRNNCHKMHSDRFTVEHTHTHTYYKTVKQEHHLLPLEFKN